jgi:hypothetical protein
MPSDDPPRDDLILPPDAWPLISLAYADALDQLLKPGWRVAIVDMVFHELIRQPSPTRQKLHDWVQRQAITLLPTHIFAQHQLAPPGAPRSKAHLGEFAMPEAMNRMALAQMALAQPGQTGVFLFEDHRIARASFLLPPQCRKVSTRAFLIFLQERGWIASAAAIERQAVLAGRAFSALRFPP